MRILIVEDSPSVRLLLTHLLGKLGHDVRECGSGAEAWNCCAMKTFRW